MKNMMQKLKMSVVGMSLAVYAAVPAMADDIEIYTTMSSAAVTIQPNILFILDSSGSMNTDVTTASVPYDSSVTYAVSCGTDRIYYTSTGGAPDCGWGSRYFNASANKCDHSIWEYDDNGDILPELDVNGDPTGNDAPGSLLATGYFNGQIAQLTISSGRRGSSSVSWQSPRIRNSSDRNKPIECYKDRGIHGESASGNKDYIDNSGTGWVSSATSDPHSVWASGANNYTLYTSNYLNYLNDPSVTTTSTRFEEMKTAILGLTDANTAINIALMQFDRSDYEGGPVLYPMEDINSARNDFQARVRTMNYGGATPLSETYFEALRYYGGGEVEYGNASNPSNQVGSRLPGNREYQTPITEDCQKNYIIYLTDGEPTWDNLSSAQLGTMPGFTDSTNCASSGGSGSGASVSNNCLAPLAGWAFRNDVAYRPIAAHSGDQTITTYTIGFDFDSGAAATAGAIDLLKRTANLGGGQFYVAQDAASLTETFNKIIAQVLAVNSTFSSPAVSVNAFNRATNLDDLYFTLFKPTQGAHWEGNFKKFKLIFDAVTRDPVVADQNDVEAVDAATGFFKDSSTSYWTLAADAPDGAETAMGGAASLIGVPTARKVYTMTGTYTDANGVLTPGSGTLVASANALDKTNAAVTETMLDIVGVPPLLGTTDYRESLLDWATGIDVLDDDGDNSVVDARRVMGDPLHAEPALVQYGLTAGGDPDLVAYVATNDGYLHAVDTIDGTEYFAFVPQEMLPKLYDIFEDTGVNGKAYGLDGNVVPWINDADGDGIISGASEHVYLYFGMRRGGDKIYSMDVTNRNNPILRWVIDGGVGDYAELGQTWSNINVEKINMGGTETTVLIFGAGYDLNQDDVTTRAVDTIGRGIFIVDADTGALIWRTGPDAAADLQLVDMEYSIPARIKPIDVDGDGYVDRLYAGDMGGQLWRIDIDNVANTASSISATGGRIADLADDNDVNENRRFYYPPDVALIIQEGQAPFVSVVAASGFRAHPLNDDVHDRFYMIRDYDIYSVPSPYVTVTEDDLFDTTSNVIGEGTDTQIASAMTSLSSAQGWYISLNQLDGSWIGEKSLAEPLILNGTAIVTTYMPADTSGVQVASCTPNDGTGSLFFVNVTDGTPTYDLSGDDTKTREDRKIFLDRGGIPPSPSVIITEGGTPTLCVGTECERAGDIGSIQKMYWYEVEE